MNNSPENIIEFTLAFNRNKSKIYNYVHKMINDRMVCDDLVQNIFLKFYDNLEKIKNKKSINYWLFKTARNEVYTYFRNKKVRRDQFNTKDADELEAESENSIIEDFELKETKELILNELQNFSYEQREVFLLKEYGSLSYKEISEIMNIDENLVKSRLFKVRQVFSSYCNSAARKE